MSIPRIRRGLRRLGTRLRGGLISDAARVSEHWGRESNAWRRGGALHWTELVQVEGRINRRVSGREEADPYSYFLSKYLGGRLPVERALTLGCGTGELERGLVQYGFCRVHDAFDIAENAIASAREAARGAGLTHVNYEVRDLNRIELPHEAYDVVWGIHSVHHVERLEHVFEHVRDALRPGGFLVLNEFVGPSRFQWTDRQLEVINGVLVTLPKRLRKSCVDGRVRRVVERPTIAEMRRIDPSEAIRSDEILPLLPAYLDVLEVKGYGGTILHMLLHEIAGNFQDPDAATRDLLDTLLDLEERLIALGDLRDDFALVIARKPAG